MILLKESADRLVWIEQDATELAGLKAGENTNFQTRLGINQVKHCHHFGNHSTCDVSAAQPPKAGTTSCSVSRVMSGMTCRSNPGPPSVSPANRNQFLGSLPAK